MAEGCKLFVYGVDQNLANADIKVGEFLALSLAFTFLISVAKFIVPDWRDKVDYSIGLSYRDYRPSRPARQPYARIVSHDRHFEFFQNLRKYFQLKVHHRS
jgi:hypothetical protein